MVACMRDIICFVAAKFSANERGQTRGPDSDGGHPPVESIMTCVTSDDVVLLALRPKVTVLPGDRTIFVGCFCPGVHLGSSVNSAAAATCVESLLMASNLANDTATAATPNHCAYSTALSRCLFE